MARIQIPLLSKKGEYERLQVGQISSLAKNIMIDAQYLCNGFMSMEDRDEHANHKL